MLKYFKYLWYVIRHKWYVLVECWKVGLYWRGIVHDLSKLTPAEFLPYVNTFYGDKPSPRDSTGAYDPIKVSAEFDKAWLHHQHNNPHHWQYWVLRGDQDAQKVLKMPFEYMMEMVCDWRGAGKAIKGRDEVKEWYTANKDNMLLHDDTRDEVEIVIFGKWYK